MSDDLPAGQSPASAKTHEAMRARAAQSIERLNALIARLNDEKSRLSALEGRRSDS